MRNFATLLISILLLSSCGPAVTTHITSVNSTLDFREEVLVLGINDSIPDAVKTIGDIKIGDSGLSVNCNYEKVITRAKEEVRKAGGNVLKITQHKMPDMLSSCHRIKAQILYVDCVEELLKDRQVEDTVLFEGEYALLHVYRNFPAGALISYNLYLGDSVIARVSNRWKRTLKIKKEGYNSLMARTEVKREIPIDIEFGKEYYLKCSVGMGAMIARPVLELVDSKQGKMEMESFKMKELKKRDFITLDDGQEIECQIIREEPELMYVYVFRNGKKIETHIKKNTIVDIIRSK